MTTKNKKAEAVIEEDVFPGRKDNGTTLLFLREEREREVIPNVMNKSVMNFVSRDREKKHYPNLHELIGSPPYSETDQLSDDQIIRELEIIENAMRGKEIFIRTFTRISSKEMHRFITRELFPVLTTGKVVLSPCELIYEEFHPNDHYLVKRAASDFLRTLLGQEMWPFDWDDEEIENKNSLKQLADEYKSVDIVSLEFDEVSIEDGEYASVIFEADMYATTNDGLFVHHFEGDGHVWLRKMKDNWRVTRAMLPDRVE